ncbi:hypothetical protein [Halorubrum sp. Boch-26]|uniref:hypothetical protein n=1 Tax=Halorubrum sp. Boch-26 TaxID=2994426 RepID=UPI0024693970|nr:hypothetical protein [Halorubrum sp. Boch-26]
MNVSDADVFWIETGSMQGEDRYILEIAEHLADFFEEKSGKETTIAIRHQGAVWDSRDFKHHSSDHYTPQWRIFFPTAFSAFSQTYYPNKIARFEKDTADNTWYSGRCYNLDIRNPSHSDVDNWRTHAESNGVLGSTGQGAQGREYGYY